MNISNILYLHLSQSFWGLLLHLTLKKSNEMNKSGLQILHERLDCNVSFSPLRIIENK